MFHVPPRALPGEGRQSIQPQPGCNAAWNFFNRMPTCCNDWMNAFRGYSCCNDRAVKEFCESHCHGGHPAVGTMAFSMLAFVECPADGRQVEQVLGFWASATK